MVRMDVHNNYDYVFKDAIVLFKDKTLDFLGLHDIAPITEPLRTESTQIEIISEFLDLAFGTRDGRGLHLEEEVDLSNDDLLRICAYNIGLSRTYKREFVTVIFVKNPTTLTDIKTEQLHYTPIIVQCSKIDADAMLHRLKSDIEAEKPINELELVYLPLFKSIEFTPTELFLRSAELIKAMQANDEHKRKTLALLITLSGKIVEQTQLDKIAEEVKKMGNVIIEYFEELGVKRGREQQKEEAAQKMVAKGYDLLDVLEITGISVERLREIAKQEAM
jgi:ABC-type cobalt transport system substrate-binding protein